MKTAGNTKTWPDRQPQGQNSSMVFGA